MKPLPPLAFSLLLLSAAFLPRANETARGVVFEDSNGNGVRDAGEAGIAGVRVSNGEDVVVTDDAGAWSLEVSDETVIFVTKPSGWATPMSPDMLPRFYYVHQPAGSPAGLRYRGVEPTGPLPDSIDFPLTRSDEPSSFEVLLFADTQPQTERELDYIRDDVVAELVGTPAKFGMTMGDIMFDDLSLLPRLTAIVGRLGIPWYNVPGNHEMNFEAESDRHSLETFKRVFGPPYYSFEYADALFVVLDNIEYQGTNPDDPNGNGGYIANVGKRQLKWLEAELAQVPEEKLVFVGMHSPLVNYGSPDSRGSNTQDRRELLALLGGRPNLYTVAGHTHTTEHHYLGEEDGFPGPGELHHHVLATVSGSWWSGPFDDRGIPTTVQRDGTPNGYHVLEVDGVEASVRYRAAGKDADYQMRIRFDQAYHGGGANGMRDFDEGELLDGRISIDAVPSTRLVVNLFDGGPRSNVSFRIDDGEPIEMQRVPLPDPFVVESFARHEDTRKSWVNAEPSSHLFRAPLPRNLGHDTYLVSVSATDDLGRPHHGHAILEVR